MTEKNLDSIYEQLRQLRDENVKFRRLYEDAIYNLDEDNFPKFSKTIRAVSENYENIAMLQGEVNNQGAKISSIVTSTIISEEEVYTANASFIIEAINGQSSVKINADVIENTGLTRFLTPNDVGQYGTTEIYGGRIKSGSIISNNYIENTQGMLIDLENGSINTKNFSIDFLGQLWCQNATIAGYIVASSGAIGVTTGTAWRIEGGEDKNAAIWNEKSSYTNYSANGIYLGVDGIAIGSGALINRFQVDKYGNLFCSNATVSGTITALSGVIGNSTSPWNIGNTSTCSFIYSGKSSLLDESNEGIYIGTDGIAIGKSPFYTGGKGQVIITKDGMCSMNSLSAKAVYLGGTPYYDYLTLDDNDRMQINGYNGVFVNGYRPVTCNTPWPNVYFQLDVNVAAKQLAVYYVDHANNTYVGAAQLI